MLGAGFRAARIDRLRSKTDTGKRIEGGNMAALEFTATQLAMMCDTDKDDIARAKNEGFSMPRYVRMYPAVTGEIKASEQLFSPAALRIISGGKRYPENATPENCEKLITAWNAASRSKYAMAV
jgi:hypothetical protein